MSSKTDSWRHHAFPFGLQRYWASDGKIRWLDGDGQTREKKFSRKATGWRPKGHTVVTVDSSGDEQKAWPDFNFEDDFEYIDNNIPEIIETLQSMPVRKNALWESVLVSRALERHRKTKLEIGTHFSLGEHDHRDLLELLFSLVDRSLYHRRSMEAFSWQKDPTSKKHVGTSNIHNAFRRDRSIAKLGPLENHHFVVLLDPQGRFLFPDGLPNWVIMRANGDRIWGRLLVPLTPRLLVYFSTPGQVSDAGNLTVLKCPRKLQIQLNQTLMLHAEEQTYFKGNPPSERPLRPLNEIWSIDPNFDPAIQLLDRVSGYVEPSTIEELQYELMLHCENTEHELGYGGEVTIPHGYKMRR